MRGMKINIGIIFFKEFLFVSNIFDIYEVIKYIFWKRKLKLGDIG